jgi:hypothetical protein
VPGLEGCQQAFGLETLRLDLHPAAERIVLAVDEMSIVGGKGGQPPAVVEQLVHEIPAVAAVALHGAAVIVDLNAMGDLQGAPVLDGELGPGGMGDADEGARRGGPVGQIGAGFAGLGRGKVERQAGGHDVPQLADLGHRRVEFGPDQGGETVGAQLAGVGDRPRIAAEENAPTAS